MALERNIPRRTGKIQRKRRRQYSIINTTSLVDISVRKLLQVHRKDVNDGH